MHHVFVLASNKRLKVCLAFRSNGDMGKDVNRVRKVSQTFKHNNCELGVALIEEVNSSPAGV